MRPYIKIFGKEIPVICVWWDNEKIFSVSFLDEGKLKTIYHNHDLNLDEFLIWKNE